jgi:hypothetical protein
MIPSLSNHGGFFIVFSSCPGNVTGSASFPEGWELEMARLWGCRLLSIEPGIPTLVRKL